MPTKQAGSAKKGAAQHTIKKKPSQQKPPTKPGKNPAEHKAPAKTNKKPATATDPGKQATST